ncbi:hypothetical protein ACGFYQ_30260 [Streptomyces sp. NPDC048258]|uniref:hypothetical protein n=1 Tax=Streptomyces sp. NPDC048258 TaxID=3365527 RepID=UPI003723E1C7
MDDQGGAGGVPLNDEGNEETRRRKPHAERTESHPKPEGTRAADTDEASRLDRPHVQPQDPDDPRKHRVEWKGPEGG